MVQCGFMPVAGWFTVLFRFSGRVLWFRMLELEERGDRSLRGRCVAAFIVLVFHAS